MATDIPVKYAADLFGGGQVIIGVSNYLADASVITAHVMLDGEVVQAALSRVDGVWSLVIQSPDGAVQSAGLIGLECAGDIVHVSSPMGNRHVAVRPARVSRALNRSAEAKAGEGDGRRSVDSPIPGRVVDVQVAEGDTIEPGQCIAVIEAMKMENEVVAESAGVVAEIFVQPGQIVDGGQALIRLE